MPLKLNSTGGGSVTLDTPSTAGTYTVTVPATDQTLGLTSGTAVASTSGTSIDFTGIPSWVKRITVMFSGVSTSGTSNILVQLGTSGGIENTGYSGASANQAGTSATFTAGFSIATSAATTLHGSMLISSVNTNSFVCFGTFGRSDAGMAYIGGSKSTSNTLTQLRITTANGTDTFDAGTINIMYEG